tara:strand:+ start:37685 stop:38065 length:381 start_codon:yes stop_codon:yes gene_type:complete
VANVGNVASTGSKVATTAAKGAKLANFAVMVGEAGGQLVISAWDKKQRRKLEETLSIMSQAQQEEFARQMAENDNQNAQLGLMLNAYARAKELELLRGTNQVRNFALILMGLGILSIGIVLALRKR